MPVPGAPTSSTPFGARAAEAGVLGRIPEEVDDLDQLVLGLVDAGHVVEGDLPGLLLVEPPGLALADAHEAGPHAAALLRRTPVDPDVEPDQQQRGPEAEEQGGQRAAALLDRLGADLDAVVDQQRLQARVHERRQRRREVGHGLRLCAGHAVRLRGVRDRLGEPAGDALAAAEDLLDVPLGDFLA